MRRMAAKGTETKKTGIIFAISVFTSFDAPNNTPRLSLVKNMMIQPITDRNSANPYAKVLVLFSLSKFFSP